MTAPIINISNLPQVPKFNMNKPMLGVQSQTVTPNIALPTIQTNLPKKPYIPYRKKAQEDLMSNYKDPYALNSIVDVISASFNDNMDNANIITDDSALRILNVIPNTMKMINDTTLQPMAEGKFGKAAINNLMALSETLDVIANPVKGYLMEGSEGAVKALGFSEAGRTNYDWDTGNGWKDLGLELVSDPLNWLTLFAKPIISGVTKATVKGVLTEAGAQAGKNLNDVVSHAVRSYVWSDKDLTKSLVNVANKLGTKADDAFMDSFKTAMEYMTENAEHLTNMKILKGVSSMLKTADAVDDSILRAGLMSTPALGLPWLAKKGAEPLYNYAREVMLKSSKPYMTPMGLVDVLKVDEFLTNWDKTATPFNNIARKVFGLDGVDEAFKLGMLEGPVNAEADVITEYLKIVNTNKYPNILPEARVKQVEDFLMTNFQDDPTIFIDIVAQLNESTGGKYKWFQDYLSDMLDYKVQDLRYNNARSSMTWDFIKENIFTTDELDVLVKHSNLEKFIKEQHGVTVDDFIKQLSELNIKYEGKFQKLEDVITGLVSEFEGKIYITSEVARKQKMYMDNNLKIATIKRIKEDDKVLAMSSVPDLLKQQLTASEALRFYNHTTPTKLQVASLDNQLTKFIVDTKDMLKQLDATDFKEYNQFVNGIIKPIQDYKKNIVKAFRDNKPKLVEELWDKFEDNFNIALYANLDKLDEIQSIAEAYSNKSFVSDVVSDIKKDVNIFKSNYQDTIPLLKGKYKQNKVEGFKSNTALTQPRKDLQIEVFDFFKEESLLINRVNVPKGYDTAFNPETHIKNLDVRNTELLKKGYSSLGSSKSIPEVDVHSIEYAKRVMADANKDKMHVDATKAIIRDKYNTSPAILSDVLDEWISQNAQQVGMSAESLKERVLDFYYTPIEEPEDFLEALDSLSNTINFLRNNHEEANKVFTDLSSKLDLYRDTYIKENHNYMTLQNDVIYYKFQLEKEWVTEQALADETLNKVVDNLMSHDSAIYNIIHNWALAGNYESRNALEGITHYTNYRKFRQGLSETDIEPEIKSAFLSTMQKFSKWDATKVKDNVNSYAYVALKETEKHYNSIVMDKKLNMETLFEEHIMKDEDVYKAFKAELKESGISEQAHTADYDVLMLKYVTKTALEKQLPDSEDFIKVFFDIETTGLNKDADNIVQYAAYVDKDNKLKRNIQSDLTPTFSTIKALTGETTNNRVQLTNIYKQLYQQDAVAEDVAFLELMDYLDKQLVTGKRVQLVIHNGESFDIPFMKSKLQRMLDSNNTLAMQELYAKGMRILKDCDTIDTYKILAKENGYLDLTHNEYVKAQLTELLQRLANDQSKFIYGDTQLYTPYLIQPMNSSVGKMLVQIGDVLQESTKGNKGHIPNEFKNLLDDVSMKEFGSVSEFASILNSNGRYIQNFFIEVSRRNRELGLNYFDKSIFGSDALETIKKFGTFESDKDYEKYAKHAEAFIKKHQALNMSQALYSDIDPITGKHTFLTGTRLYGYKEGINTVNIKEFFNFDETKPIDMKTLDKYSRYSKFINRYASEVKNGNLLKQQNDKINNLYKYIQGKLSSFDYAIRTKNTIGVPEYLLRMKPSDNYIYNYAMLQFLFNRPEDVLKQFWDDVLHSAEVNRPDLLDTLKLVIDPNETVRQTKFTDETISYIKDVDNIINIQRADTNLKEVRDIVNKDTFKVNPEDNVYDLMSLARERIKYLKNIDYKIYLNSKEELDGYIQLYTNFIDLLNRNADATKVNTKIESYANKIRKIQDIADVKAVDKAVAKAVKITKDDVDYIKNVVQSLDDNSAQRAYIQKKAVQLNKIYDAVSEFETMVRKAPDLMTKTKLLNDSKEITQRIATLQTEQVLRYSDDDLFNHLATIGHRVLSVGIDNAELAADLIARKGALKAKGIELFTDDVIKYGDQFTDIIKTQQVFLTLSKDIKLEYIKNKIYYSGLELIAPTLKDYNMEDIIKGLDLSDAEYVFYKNTMQSAREQIINLTEGKAVGTIGEIANQRYYQELYYNLPKEVRESLPFLDDFINKDTISSVNINHSVLGTMSNRQKIASGLPGDILSVYANTGSYASKYSSQISEYLQLYYAKDYSINVGLMKDMSDADILIALQNAPETKLSFLKEVNGKPVPHEIKLTSVKAIAEARRLNAVVLPTQTYNKAFEVLLDFNWSETKFNFWHKVIYAYKSGFLASFGVLFRNVIDSTVKNMISTKDPIGIIRTYADGFRTYDQYKTVLKDVMKMDERGKITGENLEMYFNNMNPAMPKDYFEMIHGFMEDGPAGEVGIMKKYYKAKRTKESTLWDKYVDMSSALMAPNNEVEQIARLSEYLWATRNGFTNSEAYALVTKTHFDYGLKTKAEMITELVFPFYTFKMRNLEYWIDEIEANPWLASLFRDVMTPVWDFDSYDEDELERNRSLQYQVLSGNVPLQHYFNSLPQELTLKVNPSFMDTYNTLTDPLGTIQNTLAPPFKALLDLATQGVDKDGFIANTIGSGTPSFMTDDGLGTDAISLIPFAGALYQRYMESSPKYGERTGLNGLFSLPGVSGVMGATQRWEQYPEYQSKQYQKKQYMPKPRKAYIRRPWVTYSQKRWHKRTYADKTYSKNFYHKNTYDAFKDVHNNVYTDSGQSKLATRMIPTSAKNLKYKLRLMHNYFR